MPELMILILAAIASVVAGILSKKLILKVWPKSGKMGINSEKVSCPECGQLMPETRKPANMRQFLWGGWTCERCGTELDKYGAKIDS